MIYKLEKARRVSLELLALADNSAIVWLDADKK